MSGAPARRSPEREPALAEPSPELLAACRRGDREAFDALFRLTSDYVHGVAFWATGDNTLAADVTQEVYLRLLSRIGQYDGRASFRTWLFRVAVNAGRDQLRRRARWLPLRETAGAPDPDRREPERVHALLERDLALRQAVASLPPKLRFPLILRYSAGLAYEEIAEVLAVPAGTVASRLSRALERLRAVLGDPSDGASR